jgi:serine/threonine protein kinase
VLRGHLLYFYLFEFRPGDTLREVLVKNPQLWVNHVGWITIDVAAAVNVMHRRGVYHYGLAPEGILVEFDEKQHVPPGDAAGPGHRQPPKRPCARTGMLWGCRRPTPRRSWRRWMGSRCATIFTPTSLGWAYAFTKCWVGEPVYPFKLRSDEEVYRLVLRNKRVEMNRVEDVEPVARIATQAVPGAAR